MVGCRLGALRRYGCGLEPAGACAARQYPGCMTSEQATAPEPGKVAQSFTPFSADELGVLERFVVQCDGMRDSRLMEVSEAEVTLQAHATTAAELSDRLPRLAEADEIYEAHPAMATELNVREADIGAFLMPFRQLYLKEDTEVGRVRNMLAAHARAKGGEAGDKALEALKGWKGDYQRVLRESPMGTMLELEPGASEGVEYTPQDLIDAWLNGIFFHWDREAEATVDGPDRALNAFFLLAAVHHVARHMMALGELARAILKEPALRSR